MAELELPGGVKFKGGRMVAVVMALTTLGGSIFAGAEVYARWVAMEQKISSYSAPDLSGFDKRLELMTSDMKAVKTRVAEIQTIATDIRQDTRADAASLHNGIAAVDKRSRQMDTETRQAMRDAERTVREITKELENRLKKQLRNALENPLLKGN